MKASRQTQYRIMSIDPWLQPYYNDIALRMERHANTRRQLLGSKADLASFANGYLYYGINRTDSGWVYREWAPGADALHLIGDFNGWNRESHPLTRLPDGTWEIGKAIRSYPRLYSPCGPQFRASLQWPDMGASTALPVDRRRLWQAQDRPTLHLRGPYRYGAGKGGCGQLSRICRFQPGIHTRSRL